MNRDPDPEAILHYAVWMKILYPEKFDQINLDNSSLREVLNDLGNYPLGHAIHIAARLRLISEEAFSNIRIDNNDWQSMKSHLGTLKSSAHERQDIINSAYQFFNEALNMKILAEPFVQITQNGLEFGKPVKPINLQPTTPPLPETRKF